MKTINNIFNKFVQFINLKNEMTADEKLEFFVEGQKHEALLKRIQDIRRNGDFVPDYNKKNAFADVKIFYKEDTPYSEFQPINSGTKLAYDRPIDFNGDLKAWKKISHIEHRKDVRNSQAKEKAYKALMEERIKLYNRTLYNFLKLD